MIKEKDNNENERKRKLEEQERIRKEKIQKEVIDLTKDGIDDDERNIFHWDQTSVKLLHEYHTKKLWQKLRKCVR